MRPKFEIHGLTELQRKLEELAQRADSLDGEHHVPMDELFNSEFMRRYTSFPSFDALIEAGGFKVENNDDFQAIPDHEWDQHIARTTKFASWKEMLDAGASEWAKRQLGL